MSNITQRFFIWQFILVSVAMVYSYSVVGAESVSSSLEIAQSPSQNQQNFPMEENVGNPKKKRKPGGKGPASPVEEGSDVS